MITSWKLSNFKAIRDRIELDLRPITLIVGANSSGKSTLLQSILLITQTLQVHSRDQQLSLNGDFVRLGTPLDVSHFERSDDPLEIALSLSFKRDRPRIKSIDLALEFTKSATVAKPFFRLHQALYTIDTNPERFTEFVPKQIAFGIHEQDDSLRYVFSISENLQEQVENLFTSHPVAAILEQFIPNTFRVRERQIDTFNRELENLFTELREILDPRPKKVDWSRRDGYYEEVVNERVGRYLIEGIPQKMELPAPHIVNLETIRTVADILDYARQLKKIALPTESPRSIVGRMGQFFQGKPNDSYLTAWLQSAGEDANRSEAEATIKMETEDREVEGITPEPLAYALNQLRDYFEHRVYYLGPLRDDPRVIYSIPNDPDSRDVGLKGEYTAAVLANYGHVSVLAPNPIPGENGKVTFSEITLSLSDAVTEWLGYMGLVDKVAIEEITNIGYQLRVQQSGFDRMMPLTSVGVGVSQVLPTLVMCLLAEAPCTLLIEQPELHLHPKVQSLLGDFFVGLADVCNKQCIVETHSEHIINRIRLRIVEADGDALLRKTNIYFVEKHKGAAQFKRVASNEYGAILEWPEGFFDQAETESTFIVHAAAEKKRRKADQKRNAQ